MHIFEKDIFFKQRTTKNNNRKTIHSTYRVSVGCGRLVASNIQLTQEKLNKRERGEKERVKTEREWERVDLTRFVILRCKIPPELGLVIVNSKSAHRWLPRDQ